MKIYAPAGDHAATFEVISAPSDLQLPVHIQAGDGETAAAAALAAVEAATGLIAWPITHDGCDVEDGAVIADCYVASLSNAGHGCIRPVGELRFRLIYSSPPVYRSGYIGQARQAAQDLNRNRRNARLAATGK
jgi:hypothetical protein